MIARLTTMLLAVVAASALLMAGCGGDDDDATGETSAPPIKASSLSKAQFVERANVACSKEKEKLLGRAEAYRPPAGSQNQSAEEQLADRLKAVIVPTVEGEITAIRALGAPKGEEAEVEAILAAQRNGLEEVSALDSVRSVNDVTIHFDEARKLANEYGITTCTVTPEPNAPEAGDE